MTFWIADPSPSAANSYRLTPTSPCFAGHSNRLFLMGGVGVAIAIDALQQHTQRPILWITAQFLATAIPGSVLDIDLETPVEARRTTLASALIREGERPVHRFMAAMAAETPVILKDFVPFPGDALPPPDDCPPKEGFISENSDYLMGQFDLRLASFDADTGHERLWMRARHGHPMSAGLLAIMADFSPGSHPQTTKCSSLDNTFRVHQIVDTEWVLMSTRTHSIAGQTFHNEAHLFAEDGTLMASASQTGLRPNPSPIAQALA